jgi:hypothetical protein
MAADARPNHATDVMRVHGNWNAGLTAGAGRLSRGPALAMTAITVVVMLVAGSAAAQKLPAGYIKTVAGTVAVERVGQVRPASLGQAVLTGDTLRTGTDGRVGVTLKDETRLSLGPQSELTIARFDYAPAERQLGFVMRLVSGTLAYISGRIAKLAPESVTIETPSSIVGIRGTHLLVAAGQAGPP